MTNRMTTADAPYRGWAVFYDPSISTVREFHWWATHPARTRVHAASRKALEAEIDAEEAA